MHRFVAAGLAAASLALFALPASAKDLPEGGMTAKEVAAWLQDQGYSAQVKPDPTTPGDEIVSSTIEGVNYDIYMYICKEGRCGSIQYAAGWTKPEGMSSSKINDWDKNKRYLRAYMDDKGNAWGEMDVDLTPGGTYEYLNGTLDRWKSIVTEYKNFIEK
jgi:hypothetical protein